MVTQQRVELRFGSTDLKFGTVSKVFRNGSFKVSFDSYRVNGRKFSGGRFVYPAAAAPNFKVTG